MSDEAGEKVFAHWDLIDRLANRRFRDRNIALEATQYVLEKLGENDWERVRQYREQGLITAYLSSVIRRLLEDFARRRFGRLTRIPSWIRSLGALWEKTYRLLCLEGHTARDVMEILKDSAPKGRSENVIREAITTIRSKVRDCGRLTEPGEWIVPEGAQVIDDSFNESLPSAAAKAEFIDLFYRSVLGTRDTEQAANDCAEAEAIKTLQRVLRLSPEERLLLKMVYEDGLKVTDAGRVLGLSTHVVHGRLRRVMIRIRQACERAGLDEVLRKYS